jgi:hypothetical protein
MEWKTLEDGRFCGVERVCEGSVRRVVVSLRFAPVSYAEDCWRENFNGALNIRKTPLALASWLPRQRQRAGLSGDRQAISRARAQRPFHA